MVYHAMLVGQLQDPGLEQMVILLVRKHKSYFIYIFHVLLLHEALSAPLTTVKGKKLNFRSRLLHCPQSSEKSGHIQWMTSSHPIYDEKKVGKKNKQNQKTNLDGIFW